MGKCSSSSSSSSSSSDSVIVIVRIVGGGSNVAVFSLSSFVFLFLWPVVVFPSVSRVVPLLCVASHALSIG